MNTLINGLVAAREVLKKADVKMPFEEGYQEHAAKKAEEAKKEAKPKGKAEAK